MYVLTLDQRESRIAGDLVDPWHSDLNKRFSAGLMLPFVRTAGDEMQGLFTSPASLLEVVIEALDSGSWWIGLGLGDPEPLGDTARDSRGAAFQHARVAVELAKERSWRCAAVGDPEWMAEAVDGMLAVIAHVRATRTARANELVNRAMTGAKQVEIARELDISPQAVSKQLKNAGFDQERRGRKAVVRVLEGVDQ